MNTGRSRKRWSRPRPRPRIEGLEDRTLLTSTLYVEFGDRFPTSGLTTTQGNLIRQQSGNNPAVNGPRVSSNDNDPIVMKSFNSTLGRDPVAARAGIMELIRRYYEPFDISVVELTANFQTVNGLQVRGVSNLDEASELLGLNEGQAKNNDNIAFVGGITINGQNPFAGGLLGISNGTDIYNYNNTDGATLTFMDGSGGKYESNIQLALTTAHEAGHSFGLKHATTGSPPSGANGKIYYNEIMSYYDVDSFMSFTRYPQVAGDGNTNPNVLNSANGNNTTYDQLVNDPNIGPNSGMEYVTGTGAHDRITITKTGPNQAAVTVEAFNDAGFTSSITVPKFGGPSYTYTIDLSKRLVIDPGGGDDLVILDASLGNLIDVRGAEGKDRLEVRGDGVVGATYTPGTNTAVGLDLMSDRRGTVTTTAGTTVRFQEFELSSNVLFTDLGSLTFKSPGGSDTLDLINAGNSSTVRGKVMDGLDFVPFSMSKITTFALDLSNAASGGAGDVVTLKANLIAPGLKNVTVRFGDDGGTLNFETATVSLPVLGGEFRVVGGAGFDTITTVGDLVVTGLTLHVLDAEGGSSFSVTSGGLIVSADSAFVYEGGDGDDTFDVENVLIVEDGGKFLMKGGAGTNVAHMNAATVASFTYLAGTVDDSVLIDTLLSVPDGGKFLYQGGDGADALIVGGVDLGVAELSFLGGAGFNQFEIGSDFTMSASSTLRYEGGDDTDQFTVLADFVISTGVSFQFDGRGGDDTLKVANNFTVSAGAMFRFDGGDGDDTLDVGVAADLASLSYFGGAGNDQFLVGAAFTLPAGSAITFDGGDGDDTLQAKSATLGTFHFIGGDGGDTFNILGSLSSSLFTFDGGAGVDSVIIANALTGNTFTFNGGSEDDTVSVKSISLPNFFFNGDAGGDTLAVTGGITLLAGNQFVVNVGEGDDAVLLGPSTISTLFNYVGGEGNDRLIFTGALSVPAGGEVLFDGGDGDDWSELLNANVTRFTFLGLSGDDVMSLKGNLTVQAGGRFLFDGGVGDDKMELGGTVNSGGATFTYTGGADTDTIASTGFAPHTWNINVNAVTYDNQLNFSTIENVLGGDGPDTFIFRPGSRFAGVLDAGGGGDILNLTALPAANLTFGTANAVDGFGVSFTGATRGTVLNINRVLGTPSTADAVIGLNQPSQWSINSGGTYSAAGFNLSFTGFEVLRGGNSSDNLGVSAGFPPSVVFDGGGGFDAIRVSGSAANDLISIGTSSVTVNGRTISFTRAEALEVFGGAGDDTFDIVAASYVFARLSIFGEQGSDTFNASPAATTNLRIFGGEGAGADTLVIQRGAAKFSGVVPPATSRAGRFNFVARQAIDFADIESIKGTKSQFLPNTY